MAGFVLSMYRECKIAVLLIALITLSAWSADGQLTIDNFEGEVLVRHGVEEEWAEAVAGATLRPEDTIKTGEDAMVVLRLDDGAVYRIPSQTIVDGADFRSMDRDELLLRLATEDMLSVPERMDDDRPVPRTTVLHGSPRTRVDEDTIDVDITTARFRINGAKFLIDQNYSGSAVLKIRETLRLYPDGDYRIDAMMLAAESLETMELYEEASRYYQTVLDEDVSSDVREIAQTRLERVKDRMGQ